MIAINFSIGIEMLTLTFPGSFLVLASIANISKNICFILASATRANINLRFAKDNNIGDLAGKSVSQFSAVSLLGMGTGMLISKVISIGDPW